jgi:lysozyme family protein
MTTFDQAFDRLINHEGGFQNNPKDRGNWTGGKVGLGKLNGTKYGITAMSYPMIDIENLNLDDAKRIYQRDFWGAAGCDLAPAGLKFDLFDTAVNSGPGMAVRLLQKACGAHDDGVLGQETALAITRMDPSRLLARFNGWRLDYMNDNPAEWAEFGRGWAQRIAENLKEA